MSRGRTSRLALMAALVVAGCGSAGAAVKALRFQGSQIGRSAVYSKAALADAEPLLAEDVANGFGFLYRFITEAEFVLCLEGTVDDGELRIDGFRLAHIESTTVNSVRYQPCRSPRYVGTAHNHPPANRPDQCTRSGPDRRSFAADSLAVVDIVLCENDRYSWTLKDGRTGIATLPPQAESRPRAVAARTK